MSRGERVGFIHEDNSPPFGDYSRTTFGTGELTFPWCDASVLGAKQGGHGAGESMEPTSGAGIAPACPPPPLPYRCLLVCTTPGVGASLVVVVSVSVSVSVYTDITRATKVTYLPAEAL